jgi:hypothetical protein
MLSLDDRIDLLKRDLIADPPSFPHAALHEVLKVASEFAGSFALPA